MAFEEVCPERIDLIHKNYRKLCNLLIDVEEWGQVVIINMLTRYARTQFLSPNQNVSVGSSGCPGSPWGGGVKGGVLLGGVQGVPPPDRSPCWRRAPRKLSMALRRRTPRTPRQRRPHWPSASPMSWTLTTACSCATPNPCCRAAMLR